jgi:hypothetical protein
MTCVLYMFCACFVYVQCTFCICSAILCHCQRTELIVDVVDDEDSKLHINMFCACSIRVCVYAPVRVCVYAPVRVCVYAPVRVCVYAPVRVCVYVPVHVCVYAPVRVCVYSPVVYACIVVMVLV